MNWPIQSQVVTRNLLAQMTISIPRPKVTTARFNPEGVSYEHFGIPVAGGFINHFLYQGTKCTGTGKQIWVQADVWTKTLSDGRIYLYVDIKPASERITHVRKIYQHVADIPADLPAQTLRFDTSDPIRGSLIFIPCAGNAQSA